MIFVHCDMSTSDWAVPPFVPGMVRAASMMRESRPMKLAAIASAVGYESESSFGKVFRRVIGISPGRYRLNHGLEKALSG